MLGRAILASVWIIVVGWPALALVLRSPVAAEGTHAGPLHDAGVLLAVTLLWSGSVAAAAVVAAVPMARFLAGQQPRRMAWLLAWLMVGLLLPPWAVYYAWWSTVPPGSWLHELAVSTGDVGVLRRLVLALAMLSWTWPVAVCCLVPACMRWTRDRSEALRLDGASWWRLQCARARVERSGLAVASIVTLLLTAGCTTAFDLAGVFTIANELRARADLGASGGALAVVSVPIVAAAAVAAAVLWVWVGRPAETRQAPARVTRRVTVTAIILFVALVGGPLLLLGFMWIRVESGSSGGSELWMAVWDALVRAVVVGAIAALLVASSRDLWSGWVVNLLGWSWVAAALLPAPLIGGAVANAWRGVLDGTMMSSGAAWTFGLLVRGGAVAVLASRWLYRTEPAAHRALRHVDAAAWWHTEPVVRAGMLGAGLVAMTLSMTDITLAASLAPPMRFPPLATSMLNAIHYQRPDAIVGLLAWIAGVAVIACFGIYMLLRLRLGVPRGSVLLLLVLLVPACSDDAAEPEQLPVPHTSTVGLPGRTPGRFDTPRALACDDDGGVYVVDKSARVQRIQGGEPVCWWTMPVFDNGKPTGLGIAPGGGIVVADTHEYRVTVFDRCGTLLRTFGSYGTGAGEFIYPTDVEVSRDGHWFVSEYGGNDRVQVFDGQGRVLRSFGGPGDAPGRFHRPQSLSLSPDGQVLWVADSGNHRIQGIDSETGEVLALIGESFLRYPYGVAALPDGSIVVTEYGAHRLSRWSAQGDLMGHWGEWGTAAGQLRMPWGVCYDPGRDQILVLDTGNARVLGIPRAALNGTPSVPHDPPSQSRSSIARDAV